MNATRKTTAAMASVVAAMFVLGACTSGRDVATSRGDAGTRGNETAAAAQGQPTSAGPAVQTPSTVSEAAPATTGPASTPTRSTRTAADPASATGATGSVGAPDQPMRAARQSRG